MFAAAKAIDIAAAKARRQRLITDARKLSQFSSVATFIATINAFISAYGAYLRPCEMAYVRFLAQRARLVPGVVWARTASIAKEIGFSVSAVKAAQRRLEHEFGLIKRISRRKVDGKQGSSFTVVQPLDKPLKCPLYNPEMPRQNRNFGPLSTANKKTNKDEVNKREIKNVQMGGNVRGQAKEHQKDRDRDRDRGARAVPRRFAATAKQSQLSVGKLWSKVRLAARRMGLNPAAADVVQVAVKTLRHNLRSLRDGRVYGDFFGYFYRSMIHQLAIHRRRTNASLFDWLGVSHAAAEAVAAVQEVAAAVAHQERMEASGGYEERQERRIVEDPELMALLQELEQRKRALGIAL